MAAPNEMIFRQIEDGLIRGLPAQAAAGGNSSESHEGLTRPHLQAPGGQLAGRFAHLTSAVIWLSGVPLDARGQKGSSHEAVWSSVRSRACDHLCNGRMQ